MHITTEIVIVGGGPTGWMLANELALRAVNVVVVEKRLETVPQSRALSMHPRSIEVLALRNIADRFVERGVQAPTSHYASLDTRLDFTQLPTSFPFNLLIPQTTTERLLEERAVELGVDIRRGWDVATVEDNGDGVRLTGRTQDDDFVIDARYVVGTDGARSLVRDQSGIGFPGNENTMSIYFGDVFMEGTGVPATGRFQRRTRSGIIEGFPMPDGRRRIVVIDAERLSVPAYTPVTIEEMQDGARRIMGEDVTLRDPSWMSRFGNETRLADQYRRGRAFLAGDAAHIHLPAGGQGMNTGLQDAMNLGWKLAGVVRGLAPESLLDSYHRERRPIGERLVANTLAQGALIRNFLSEGDALWNAFSELLELPVANRYVTEMITALDTRYPDPLPGFGDSGSWTGARLQDTLLTRADGSDTTLFAMLHDGAWIDLRVADTAPSPLPQGFATEWVKPVAIRPPAPDSQLAGLASVLVRPDGHVAYAA